MSAAIALSLVLIAIAGCDMPQTKQPEWAKRKTLTGNQDHPNGDAVDDRFITRPAECFRHRKKALTTSAEFRVAAGAAIWDYSYLLIS